MSVVRDGRKFKYFYYFSLVVWPLYQTWHWHWWTGCHCIHCNLFRGNDRENFTEHMDVSKSNLISVKFFYFFVFVIFHIPPSPSLDRPVWLISGAAPQPHLVAGKMQKHQTVQIRIAVACRGRSTQAGFRGWIIHSHEPTLLAIRLIFNSTCVSENLPPSTHRFLSLGKTSPQHHPSCAFSKLSE